MLYSKVTQLYTYAFLLYWLCQSLSLCGSQQTMENSERDGNIRPLYLPPEKSVWRLRQSGKRLECSRYESIIHIEPISKVWFQQYVNWELPDVQAEFQRGRGTRDQIANICWMIEAAREFQKNISFTDYAKAFDCVDHNKLWKILKEMGLPDHLTCLLRNLYAGQEATVWIGHGITD